MFFVLFKAIYFLIYQWNPTFYFSQFLNTRKTFFFTRISGYLNHLNPFIVLLSSNTFLCTDGILCVFSLILKYQEKCLFRMKTTYIDEVQLRSHYVFLIVIFSSNTFLSTNGIPCVFCSKYLNGNMFLSFIPNSFKRFKLTKLQKPLLLCCSDKYFLVSVEFL